MSNSENRKQRITLEGKIKLPLSLALVVYSFVVSGITGMLISTAMLLSFGGDFYLMKNGNCFYNKGNNDFNVGVFMFMLSHLWYAHMMNTAVSHIISPIIFCVAVIFAITILVGLKKKVVVIAFYGIVLILSVVNTFNFNIMAFIGGMLFLISDACIGIFDFIKKKGLVRDLLVWGTYVPAQILMLTSFII